MIVYRIPVHSILVLTHSSSLLYLLGTFRLLKQGYSLESIANATMQADTITRERLNSANKQSWDRVNAVGERFGRVLKKALGKKIPTQTTVVAYTA